MDLQALRHSLIDAKKKKETLINICDNEIDGLIVLISDFDVKDRMAVPFGEAILLSEEEYFLSVIKYLIDSKEEHVGFKVTQKEGEARFSVRLNLIEQLVFDHYGELDCTGLKARMLTMLQRWKKSSVPVHYRRTTSVDLVNPKSESYPQTYAIEMNVSTFAAMFDKYLKSDGNEVW